MSCELTEKALAINSQLTKSVNELIQLYGNNTDQWMKEDYHYAHQTKDMLRQMTWITHGLPLESMLPRRCSDCSKEYNLSLNSK